MTYSEHHLQDENTDFLLRCILSLQNMEEAYDFFSDLCTIPEIKSMARRLAVAKMLKEKMKFEDIVKETGASTATVSRVNRSLCYGNHGYLKIINRVQEDER